MALLEVLRTQLEHEEGRPLTYDAVIRRAIRAAALSARPEGSAKPKSGPAEGPATPTAARPESPAKPMSGPSEDPEAWNAPRPARSRPPIHALLVLYRNVDSGELRVPTRRGLETIQDDSYQRVAGEARVAYLPDLLEEASAVEANPGSRYVPISHQLLVAARYGNRCAFPGCLDKVDEVHHVQALSEGGASQADNLVPTCALHHDALHSGWVQGRREASDAWVYARPGQEPEGQGPADLSRKRFRQRP